MSIPDPVISAGQELKLSLSGDSLLRVRDMRSTEYIIGNEDLA